MDYSKYYSIEHLQREMSNELQKKRINEIVKRATGSIAFNNKWLYFSGTDSTHYVKSE